jgi:hypothetical protein
MDDWHSLSAVPAATDFFFGAPPRLPGAKYMAGRNHQMLDNVWRRNYRNSKNHIQCHSHAVPMRLCGLLSLELSQRRQE